MKKSTDDKLKRIVMIITIVLLVIILAVLLSLTTDNNYIKSIKKFTNEGTKILYVSRNNKYSEYIVNLLDKYDAEYMHINSSKLSNIEKKKIQKIVNYNNLSNLVIIFENGKIIETLIDFETENSVNDFLQKNDIIPEVIGDNKNIINSVSELINTDFSIIYIPYKYIEGIDTQDEILKNIANQYSINYKMVNAYLLSNIQKEKLNLILKVSPVDEQIIILVKDKKIIGSIREKQNSSEYIDKLYELNFIEKQDNYMEEIDYEKFNNIIESKEKSIITIVRDNKSSQDLEKILNKIIIDYNINVNYINVGDIDSELSKNISDKLKELGYDDGFTLPMTIMIESGKILNYIIGLSTEDYIVDIFKENGIIK